MLTHQIGAHFVFSLTCCWCWNCAEVMLMAVLTAVPHAQVSIPGGGDITIKAYLEEFYSYKTPFIGPVFGILCAFTVFFGALAILSLKLINYQRR